MQTSLHPSALPTQRAQRSRMGRWIAACLLLGFLGLAAVAAWKRDDLQQWAGLQCAEDVAQPEENKDAVRDRPPAPEEKPLRPDPDKGTIKTKPLVKEERPPEKDKVKKQPVVMPPPEPVRLLRVVAPPSVRLQPGKKARVSIKVERENVAGPVDVSFTELPKGVRVAPARLAAGAPAVDVDFTAERGTPAGETEAGILAVGGDVRAKGRLRILVQLPPLEKEIANAVGMKLLLIPVGKFARGSPPEEAGRSADEGPVREIEISQPFYLAAHEVTQGQFERVTGRNPSWFRPDGEGRAAVKDLATQQFPVESVSWSDADEFCRRLSELPEEKAAGRVYRLPTEAEWEYACRAGSADPVLTPKQANIDTRDKTSLQRPAPVGSYPPNAWGLFDMHGNVFEWCSDWYDAGDYAGGSVKDSAGAGEGNCASDARRVVGLHRSPRALRGPRQRRASFSRLFHRLPRGPDPPSVKDAGLML